MTVLMFPTKHDPWLTYGLLSNHWGVTKRTLQNYVRQGMPSVKNNQGQRMFRLSMVEAWRDGTKIGLPPAPADGNFGDAA